MSLPERKVIEASGLSSVVFFDVSGLDGSDPTMMTIVVNTRVVNSAAHEITASMGSEPNLSATAIRRAVASTPGGENGK
jgi:hypothetical protein